FVTLPSHRQSDGDGVRRTLDVDTDAFFRPADAPERIEHVHRRVELGAEHFDQTVGPGCPAGHHDAAQLLDRRGGAIEINRLADFENQLTGGIPKQTGDMLAAELAGNLTALYLLGHRQIDAELSLQRFDVLTAANRNIAGERQLPLL